MPVSVVMPALEIAQETGKLISWRKKEGDPVAKGELLLEIETDKAVMEIESPAAGVLAGITAQPGAEVAVGTTIAWILQAGETVPAQQSTAIPSARRSASENRATSEAASAYTATLPIDTEIRISPKARRLAKEHGVDLTALRGTGPGGEILAADILSAASSPAPAPSSPGSSSSETLLVPARAPNAISKIMAERTALSWATVPHFFVTRELDASALIHVRQQLVQELQSIRPTHTDLLVHHVARSLSKHALVNASWNNGAVKLNPEINVAIAIAVEGGVVAPVIHGAEKLAIAEIAKRRQDLAARARSNTLRPGDIFAGTFTISNLGMLDVDSFTAIITPPQSAILAVGKISDKVVALDGKPAVRPVMTVTLSGDHRVFDGAVAATFLKTLAAFLMDRSQVNGR